MIEPTDEMVQVFRHAFNQAATDALAKKEEFGGDRITRAGLAAVLAIVERDNIVRPAECDCPHPAEDMTYCELLRGHKGKHSATVTKAVNW